MHMTNCVRRLWLATITGVPPLTFRADGRPLISLSMLGNGQQTGTPTHDNPIMPDFCGKLVGSDWTIPITCAGQTNTVYLGQTQTVRAISEIVFDGTEDWKFGTYPYLNNFTEYAHGYLRQKINICICTHLPSSANVQSGDIITSNTCCFNVDSIGGIFYYKDTSVSDLSSFKSWLQQQYTAKTPVTVWYVLTTPETAIVNEPLCKIGDYADELHSEDTGVIIPTTRGQNALTVGTDLQPSSVSIAGHIK